MKHFNKPTAVVLSLLMLLSIVFASAINVSAATYVKYGDYTCEVVSPGFVYIAGYNGSETELSLPISIEGVRVIGISDDAFADSKITSVRIPTDYKVIGNRAFYNAANITEIVLPSALTSIGSSAFAGMTGLVSFDMSAATSLTTISNGMLSGAVSLKSIEIPDNITSIYSFAFNNTGIESVVLPNHITYLGENVFNNCASLVSVKLPDGTTNIPEYTFNGCSSLTSVDIPDSVTTIGNRAFYNCTSLENITLPLSLTSLGARVFCNDSALTEIFVPHTVTSIGLDCFYPMNIMGTIKVNCAKDSYVEEYCSDTLTGFKSYLKGDFNLDGSVDVRDVTDMQKYLVGSIQSNEISVGICNVFNDSSQNKLDIRDVTKIQKFIVKLVTSLD